MNKYFSWIINIGYIVGMIWSIEKGYFLWFMIITSGIVIFFYHKQLWKIMNEWGGWYADTCRSINNKMWKK